MLPRYLCLRGIPLCLLLLLALSPVAYNQAIARKARPTKAKEPAPRFNATATDGEKFSNVSIKGKDKKPLNDTEHVFFNVDGLVLQVQLASISEFAPGAREKKLDDRSILVAHRDWESKFIEDLLHSKIQVRSFNARLSSGSDALMWQFDLPEGFNSDAKKQLYLTVVNKDYVLLLNGVATATISEEVVRKFLLDTIATLKISPTPIDVKKLSESIRKGTSP